MPQVVNTAFCIICIVLTKTLPLRFSIIDKEEHLLSNICRPRHDVNQQNLMMVMFLKQSTLAVKVK